MPVKKSGTYVSKKIIALKLIFFASPAVEKTAIEMVHFTIFCPARWDWDNLTGIFPCHKLHDVFTEVSEWTHVLLNITLRSPKSWISVLKTECAVFPNTDRPWLMKFINFFYYLNSTKCFPEEPLWFKAVIMARSSMNWTIFERVNGSWNRLS